MLECESEVVCKVFVDVSCWIVGVFYGFIFSCFDFVPFAT